MVSLLLSFFYQDTACCAGTLHRFHQAGAASECKGTAGLSGACCGKHPEREPHADCCSRGWLCPHCHLTLWFIWIGTCFAYDVEDILMVRNNGQSSCQSTLSQMVARI